MKISSTKLRHGGLFILIGILIGVAFGFGLATYTQNEKQPVLLHYADNYSGELSGVIDDKKVYTITDENGNQYIVSKNTYDSVSKGDKLDSIAK